MIEQTQEITFDEAWELLTDIPVNNEDEIEEPFLHFDIGDDKFEIWGWLEEHYDVCIGDMF